MNADFGGRIKMLREKRGMTQIELSKRLNITKSMVSAYETGVRKPSYEVLMQISLLFGASMDYLFANEYSSNIEEATRIDISDLRENGKRVVQDMVDVLREGL